MKLPKFSLELFSVIVFFLSCQVKPKSYNLEFVKRYNDYEFADFVGTGIVVRGYRNGNFVLFISDLRGKKNQGPYIVNIDEKKNIISQTSCKLMRDSSSFNREKFDRLAMEFMKFNVFMLSVDTNKNVYVNLVCPDAPASLVRFSNLKFKTGVYEIKWKRLEGNWFEDELNP